MHWPTAADRRSVPARGAPAGVTWKRSNQIGTERRRPSGPPAGPSPAGSCLRPRPPIGETTRRFSRPPAGATYRCVGESRTTQTVSSCAPVEGDCPSLVYVDPTGTQRSVALADRVLLTIGRRPEADVCLPWDSEVSRLHAELLDRAAEWLIIDDGLSQNGTYVNGVRVEGRRRLADGDLITVGRTNLTFCNPRESSTDITLALTDLQPIRTYSEQQQRVLRSLCRPLLGDGDDVRPASDEQVVQDLGLPVGVVARELDAIAHTFDFDDLPLEERRLRTALSALGSGIVPPTED
jgi:FHA domain